ncbi:hypothetical protein SAMN03159407_0524 [Rhizobium sp. NFR12]|nr:hypothetical protein SAMN03159407_0524 [Rhizobium sp. NFR12]
MRRNPSPPSPQGGGLNPAVPSQPGIRLADRQGEFGRRVPRVFSPLVGEMAGRPEGVLRPAPQLAKGEAA